MNRVLEADDPEAIAPQSRVETVVRQLEEDIVLGRLRPRQRLLEEELAARFGAKRHVVRRALAELESMGMIVHQPNRGATVRDFTIEEVEQIYTLRELLEREAALLMPLPAPAEVIKELRGIHARHSDAVDRHDSVTIFRENLAFHQHLFAICGNPYLVEMIEQLAHRSHAIRFYSISDTEILSRMRNEHGAIVDSLESGDRERLVELVSGHIRPSKEVYIRLLTHGA